MNQDEYIGKQIRRLRKAKNLSSAQLGKMIKPEKTESAVTSWERGRTQPDGDILIQLCIILGAEISDFYYKTPEYEYAVVRLYDEGECSGFTEVPLYGSIAAGTPIDMITIDELHEIPTIMHDRYPDAFLLRVSGESMNRILPSGCYALIDPCKEINNDNDPYAVCVNGFEATIKRVKKLENGFQLVPDSTDPTFPVQTFNYNEPGTDEITVIGKVVWHVIPFEWAY